jgi:hypothetical protein
MVLLWTENGCKTGKIKAMKKHIFPLLTASVIIFGFFCHTKSTGRTKGLSLIATYLPAEDKNRKYLRKYRMTTIHINRDLYGYFMNKTRVTGEYTRGFSDGHMTWNNAVISHSTSKGWRFSGRGPGRNTWKISATAHPGTCCRPGLQKLSRNP